MSVAEWHSELHVYQANQRRKTSEENMRIGVYIGRFQPFHNAHYETMIYAMSQVDHLVVVVGSAHAARNIKNPWTAVERIAMIQGSLPVNLLPKVHFVSVRDHHYNDNDWVIEVRNGVSKVTQELVGDIEADVTLFGFEKDASSYYLKMFPQWKFHSTDRLELPQQHATDVRNAMFEGTFEAMRQDIPLRVGNYIATWMQTHVFYELRDEYRHVQGYKKLWEAAPYPPTFVTVDALVIKSGHILLVKRKGQPGRGQWALPGGFINEGELLVDAAMRELREETGLKTASVELKRMITNNRVFDYPGRSLRGRTITHAYCINMGYGSLPKVKGDDDAAKAWWFPIDQLTTYEEYFYEDHYHIIQYFLGQGNKHVYY
jgi:bifunctional NMN adenylyltransferase/nudix hydrolase